MSIDWDGALPKSGMEELLSEYAGLLYSYYNCLCERGFTKADALLLIVAWQELYWRTLFSKLPGSSGWNSPPQ